jgi:hypothetical protein
MPSPAGKADLRPAPRTSAPLRPATLGSDHREPALDPRSASPARCGRSSSGLTALRYNVFAIGPSGTGSRTTHGLLEDAAAGRPSPPDHVYFFNFDAPDRPLAVTLPAGRGAQLARDVADAMEETRREIRRVFESDQYRHSRKEITDALDAAREKRFAELDKVASGLGFAVQVGPVGVVTAPLVKGHPATTRNCPRPSSTAAGDREAGRGARRALPHRRARDGARARARARSTADRAVDRSPDRRPRATPTCRPWASGSTTRVRT